MGCQCGHAASPEGLGAAPSAAIIEKKVDLARTTRVLALGECRLKVLPASAVRGDVATFRTVDLSRNLLGSLPGDIGCWTGLQNFLCSENQLQELPAAVGQLASLQKLVLSKNRLRALPLELAQLSKLHTLQLRGNRLVRLLGGIFSGPLSGALEELDLSDNLLQELPEEIGALGSLVRLEVARNELRALPAALGRLAKLQHLDAADNQLTDVPPTLLQGTNLSELWLKGNPVDRLRLQELPGFSAFLERRKQRIDARIDGNVVGRIDLSVCGLD